MSDLSVLLLPLFLCLLFLVVSCVFVGCNVIFALWLLVALLQCYICTCGDQLSIKPTQDSVNNQRLDNLVRFKYTSAWTFLKINLAILSVP